MNLKICRLSVICRGGGVLDPEAGQVVRVTGLVFLFQGLEQQTG